MIKWEKTSEGHYIGIGRYSKYYVYLPSTRYLGYNISAGDSFLLSSFMGYSKTLKEAKQLCEQHDKDNKDDLA